MTRNVWFPFRTATSPARVRLVCLPFAGGSALIYRPWHAALPPWIEVCAVELPGRGTRYSEPLVPTMEQLVPLLVEQLAPLADRPLALFGHSMGARIAFELARRLTPVHLFASASAAPDLPRRTRYAGLSDPELLAALGRLGGVPAPVLADRGMMQLFLPVIRNDLGLVEHYRCDATEPLALPITVFAGAEDAEVSLDDARGWSRLTTHRDRATPIVLEAGHFFLAAHAKRIHDEIVRALSSPKE